MTKQPSGSFHVENPMINRQILFLSAGLIDTIKKRKGKGLLIPL